MTPSSRCLRLGTLILAGMASTLIVDSSEARASSVRARQAGRDFLIVDIRTDTPLVTSEGLPEGYHRVTIADLPSLDQPGDPGLPYRTFLVGLPEGKTVEVSARAVDQGRLGSFQLAPVVAASSWNVTDPGDGPPSREDLEEAALSGKSAGAAQFPGVVAVVQGQGVLRDQPFAEIRVYPVQYDPRSFDLVHFPQVQVRVKFVDAQDGVSRPASDPRRLDPDPSSGPQHLRPFDAILRRSLVNYDMIARDREAQRARVRADVEAGGALDPEGAIAQDASSSQPSTLAGAPGSVKVSVTDNGMYAVTPAQLTAAGVDVSMVDPRTFHMTAGGADVPILVDGESDGSFDPNDRVIFYGTGITGSRYTRTNVYWLAFNGTAGPRLTSRSGLFTGAGTTPASFVTTVHSEQNPNYTSKVRPGVTEAWYWGLQALGATASMNYPITVNRIDPVAHTLAVRASMLGLTSASHTVRLSLNGTQIAENTFSGQITFNQTASPSSTLLVNGSNTLTMLLVSGSGGTELATDFFEIDYRRTYAVDGDQLQFDGEGTGNFHFSLSNLGSSNLVLMDVTAPGSPQAVTIPAGQISAGPPFTAQFEDILASDRAYAISTRSALKTPVSVVLEIPSNLASPSNGADHIIITDRSLLAAMQPLAALRQAQGMRTMVVATDDIYDEFNFGRSDPHAIKTFLSYAYNNYALPKPSYVVLAGDGHIDYTNNLGISPPETVPPILLPFASFEAPSDNAFVAITPGDVFPEMFVGRLPIRSVGDANTVVTNIVNYETNPPFSVLNQRSLFVADNNDAIFQAILNNLAMVMPPTMAKATAYLPGDPNHPATSTEISATTDAIINTLNQGALTSIYLGHGNVTLWAEEKILEHNPNPPTGSTARTDLTRLTNSGFQTFLLALNCINGYFVDLIAAGPGHQDYSLAEEFLRRPNRGAIAAWAPASLGQLSDYDSITNEFYNGVFLEQQTTLGPAAVGAVIDAVNIYGINDDNIESMIFFGDPATRLPLDTDADGLVDYREVAVGSNPLDADTDDDGIADGAEVIQLGTSPINADTDGDGIFDGTEVGVTAPLAGTDLGAGHFVADADPATTTNPNAADTDGGGVADGIEDANHNGRVDSGETDPNNPADDIACPGPMPEVQNVLVSRSGSDIVLTWDAAAQSCLTYRIYAATNAPFPKSSFAPFTLIGSSATPNFTHVGAAANGNQYDYLVVVMNPQLGEGPFGSYGR